MTFSGGTYTLAWRANDPQQSFITTATLSASGNGAPLNTRSVVAGAGVDVAVAVNASGETVVVDSEVAKPGDTERAHAYFAADMQPTPAPPQTPRNVSTAAIAGVIIVSWSPAGDASGQIIDADTGAPLAFAPAGATRVSIPLGHRRVQVRAYDAGGLSALPAATAVTPAGRRRAAR